MIRQDRQEWRPTVDWPWPGGTVGAAADADSAARREQWRNARRVRRSIDGCITFARETAPSRRAAQ